MPWRMVVFIWITIHLWLMSRKGMKAEYSMDGVHPNEAGYKVMAVLAEKAIALALKKQ